MPDQIIKRIFAKQDADGLWAILPESHNDYPRTLHYAPNFRATIWVLLQLADMGLDQNDERVKKPLQIITDHFYDSNEEVYTIADTNHFPLPCLNGNLIFLDAYFNGPLRRETVNAISFLAKLQRFDDGEYAGPVNRLCTNKSCYGSHTCYWGIVKLLKGLSFIPAGQRTGEQKDLLQKCIDFILLHRVCYSSRRPEKLMIPRIDKLSFPYMYKSDFLEILWLLRREKVKSDKTGKALELLKSKRNTDGTWNLERKINNLVAGIGQPGKPNGYITRRAREVLDFYGTYAEHKGA